MDCLSCDHKFGSHAINGCRTSSSDVSTQRVQITTVTSRSAILVACVVCADAEEGDVRQGDSLFSLLIPFESSFMFLRIWAYQTSRCRSLADTDALAHLSLQIHSAWTHALCILVDRTKRGQGQRREVNVLKQQA